MADYNQKKVKGSFVKKPLKTVPRSKDYEASFAKEKPTWKFRRTQKEKQWKLTCDELIRKRANTTIFDKLIDFESLTWQEIKQQQHGKNGKSSSHYIDDFNNLHKDARKRLEDLSIDSIFSLRICGEVRIFGVLHTQSLEILWFDAKHEIYPIDKE